MNERRHEYNIGIPEQYAVLTSSISGTLALKLMNGTPRLMEPIFRKHDRVVNVVAVLMILFGLSEVVTGFRHRFFGIHTAHVTMATYLGVAIGVLYAVAGALILTMKKPAVALALVLLIVVILGRIAMVFTGLYPIDSGLQLVAIAMGTSIAAAFAIFIGIKWNVFT